MNLAVLIIDMQEKYLVQLDLQKRETMINAQISLLNECVIQDIPAVLIEYEKSGETIKEIADALSKVHVKNLIVKTNLNAFYKTRLERILDDWSTNKVILAGVEASACVYETALGAIVCKYKIATAQDLIADPMSFVQKPEVLELFRNKGDLFENHEELIQYLNQAVIL